MTKQTTKQTKTNEYRAKEKKKKTLPLPDSPRTFSYQSGFLLMRVLPRTAYKLDPGTFVSQMWHPSFSPFDVHLPFLSRSRMIWAIDGHSTIVV